MISDFYQQLQPAIQLAESLIPKKWGFEIIVTNTDKFCMKYLVMWKGGRMSLHTHKEKTEIFVVQCGKVLLETNDERILSIGEKKIITPGEIHSLWAYEDSIIIEVSTHDSPADSFRYTESSFNPSNLPSL